MTKTELFEQCEKHFHDSYIKPLNRCQAENTSTVCFDDSTQWIILRSYSTIVAAFSCVSGTVYVRDYYSATTVQHVTKFMQKISADFYIVRIAYLYKRSDNIAAIYYRNSSVRYHKRSEIQTLLEDDYKHLIYIYEMY